MIEHYVFIKLKAEHATAAGRRETMARMREVLARIPGVVDARVGAPADDAAVAAWDVSAAVRFATLADVEAYRVDPGHRALVDDFLRPRMEVIKAWSFDVGSA